MSSFREDDSAVRTSGRAAPPPPPPLEWIGTLTAGLGPPSIVGQTAHGTRMILRVTSGSLAGPSLSGIVVPISGDWIMVRPDGVAELGVRGTIQMQDGSLLYVTYGGYLTDVMALLPRWQEGEEIPRDAYSFVVTPRFEVGAPAYDWLQRTVVIGIGSFIRGGISCEFFAVRA